MKRDQNVFIHLKKLSNLKQKLKIFHCVTSQISKKSRKSEKQSNSIDWQPLMDDCWIKHYHNFEANPPTKQFYPCRPKHSRSNHSSCHQLGEFNKEAKNSKRLKLTVDRIHSPTIRISSNPVRKKKTAQFRSETSCVEIDIPCVQRLPTSKKCLSLLHLIHQTRTLSLEWFMSATMCNDRVINWALRKYIFPVWYRADCSVLSLSASKQYRWSKFSSIHRRFEMQIYRSLFFTYTGC